MKKTLEEEIAELGVRQFVRTTMVKILKNRIGVGMNADEVLKEMNETLIEDFRTIARDESNKIINQIGELVKKDL